MIPTWLGSDFVGVEPWQVVSVKLREESDREEDQQTGADAHHRVRPAEVGSRGGGGGVVCRVVSEVIP